MQFRRFVSFTLDTMVKLCNWLPGGSLHPIVVGP